LNTAESKRAVKNNLCKLRCHKKANSEAFINAKTDKKLITVQMKKFKKFVA